MYSLWVFPFQMVCLLYFTFDSGIFFLPTLLCHSLCLDEPCILLIALIRQFVEAGNETFIPPFTPWPLSEQSGSLHASLLLNKLILNPENTCLSLHTDTQTHRTHLQPCFFNTPLNVNVINSKGVTSNLLKVHNVGFRGIY